MANSSPHYIIVCILPAPGNMQVKKHHYQRQAIPQEGSDLGSLAHILSESHVWLYSEPVGC